MRKGQINLKKVCLATAVVGMSVGAFIDFESKAQSSSSSGGGGGGGCRKIHAAWYDYSTGVSVLKCGGSGDQCC